MTRLANVIKAILLVSGKEVEESFIKEKLEIKTPEFNKAISEIMAECDGESGIQLLRFNGKLQFASNPEYSKEVEAVLNPIKEKELTSAMLETLAIVAYKQPVTRMEIEEIRGKDCTYAVQNLSSLGMIEVVGRKEAIGKPLLFATTDEFLKRFSIGDVNELPDYEEFLERLRELSVAATTAQNTTVEKPMFDFSDETPDFLKGEEVQKVE